MPLADIRRGWSIHNVSIELAVMLNLDALVGWIQMHERTNKTNKLDGSKCISERRSHQYRSPVAQTKSVEDVPHAARTQHERDRHRGIRPVGRDGGESLLVEHCVFYYGLQELVLGLFAEVF